MHLDRLLESSCLQQGLFPAASQPASRTFKLVMRYIIVSRRSSSACNVRATCDVSSFNLSRLNDYNFAYSNMGHCCRRKQTTTTTVQQNTQFVGRNSCFLSLACCSRCVGGVISQFWVQEQGVWLTSDTTALLKPAGWFF